jgi:hypothetical protein
MLTGVRSPVSENRDLAWLRRGMSSLDMVFFEGHLEEIPVVIRWARWRPVKTVESFYYATYLDSEIEVNRVLAWSWVPDYFVMSVIYHECLHHVVGMDHDLAFKYAEQKFPHHTDALLWELQNVERLVAAPNPFARSKT